MTKTGHFCNVEEKYPIALPPKTVDPPIAPAPIAPPPIALPPYGSEWLDWQEAWLQKYVVQARKLTLLFRNTINGDRHDNFLKIQSAFGKAGTIWLARAENGCTFGALTGIGGIPSKPGRNSYGPGHTILFGAKAQKILQLGDKSIQPITTDFGAQESRIGFGALVAAGKESFSLVLIANSGGMLAESESRAGAFVGAWDAAGQGSSVLTCSS